MRILFSNETGTVLLRRRDMEELVELCQEGRGVSPRVLELLRGGVLEHMLNPDKEFLEKEPSGKIPKGIRVLVTNEMQRSLLDVQELEFLVRQYLMSVPVMEHNIDYEGENLKRRLRQLLEDVDYRMYEAKEAVLRLKRHNVMTEELEDKNLGCRGRTCVEFKPEDNTVTDIEKEMRAMK